MSNANVNSKTVTTSAVACTRSHPTSVANAAQDCTDGKRLKMQPADYIRYKLDRRRQYCMKLADTCQDLITRSMCGLTERSWYCASALAIALTMITFFVTRSASKANQHGPPSRQCPTHVNDRICLSFQPSQPNT